MTKSKSKKIFKAVTSGALVASSFSSVAAPISATYFSDIENNYHKEDILQLLDRGVINGFPDGTFQPEKSVTRGQAAKIIAGILELDTKNVPNPNFSDVDTNHEFYPYIAALAKAGIINGYEDNTFRQDVTITRGQMAKMIALGFNLPTEGKHPFTDVSDGSIYSPYIAALYNNEVTKGTTDTTFSPRNHVSRGQLASFVIRADEKINATQNISGKITAVTTESITVGGKQYSFNDLSILETAESRNSLLNSSISFVSKNNLIDSINTLKLSSSSTSFDGKGIEIEELIIPEQLTKLSSVNANTVSIQNLVAFASLNPIATQNTTTLTIENSTIQQLISSSQLSLVNIDSIIHSINALKARTISLTGAFNVVLTGKDASIHGNAFIEELVGPNLEKANITLDPNIKINQVKIGESTISFQEALRLYGYQLAEIHPPEDSNNTVGGGSSGGGGSSTPGGDSGSGSSGDSGSSPGTEGDTTPSTPTGEVELTTDTVVDFTNNQITVGTETYNLSEAQSATLGAYLDEIADITISNDGNGNAIIEGIVLNTQGSIDGTSLIAVNNVTVKGTVKEIKNVQAKTLHVTSTASTLTFDNVEANITAVGSFKEISGATGEQLTIASTEKNIVVNNVASKNITVQDAPIRQLAARSLMASLNTMFASTAIATTTTMTVTFNDGDYSGQTLTVERKDTLIDLRGKPFSKVTIKNDSVALESNDVSAIDVAVANNVTNLRLNANVNVLSLDLQHPIAISGNGKSIATLELKATATDTNAWVDLIGATANAITLNGSTITSTHDIFKKYTSDRFASSLVRDRFGYYTIEADVATDEKLKYILLKENDTINTTSIPTTAIEYTGTTFIPYADTPKVVVYKEKNNAMVGYSLAEMPAHGPVSITDGIDTVNNTIVFKTRFSDAVTPKQALQYVFIFKESSEPYINTNLTGTWTKKDGLNTYRLQSDLINLSGKTLIVSNELVGGLDVNIQEDIELYINALKTIATYATPDKLDNPDMIYDLLKRIATTTAVPFDSSFLSRYVEALNSSPSSYNTKDQLEGLLTKVQSENNYDPSYIKTAEDLYLTGKISSQFEYSAPDVVKATLSDNGELLFIGNTAGSTTVKVSDSYGLSTLVNITVDANKKISNFAIVEATTTNTEFLRGMSDFRIATKGTDKILLPTNLKETLAITRDGNALKRHVVTLNGTQYTIASEEITPLIKPIQEFGFNDISVLDATLVGAWTTVDGNLVLYPVYNGTETIFVGDGKNKTAVHLTVGTNITANIARASDSFSIANDLILQSAKTLELTPSNATVHLYNDGSTLRAFAQGATTASYEIKDQANNTALVNVIASNTDGVISVDKFEVVNETLNLDAGVTVQSVSNPIVRVVNNTLFATATGTTTVTLSNGVQYTVMIGYTGNQYNMEATEVQNLIINATDLQMTNITDAATTNTSVTTHKIDNNSKLVVAMNTDTTATLTLTSSNNEKTVIHVTKANNNYTYTTDVVALTKEALGLNTLTDAFGSAVDVLPARAKVTAAGDKVNIYNFEVGNRTFRVTDGTNSTAVNVTVTANGNSFTSTPQVVKHELKDVTVATDATIASNAVHLKDGVLYATGLGLVNNEATVSVPLENGANYVIKVKLDPDTGLYSFDETATITFNKTINKADLGFDTLISATPPANSNTEALVMGENVIVSVTKDTETRIQVNGVDGTDTTAKSFIYVKRADADASNSLQIEVEKATDAIDLKNYGYNTAPLASWSHNGIARAHIASDLTVDFYALALGKARHELIAGDKKLLVNVAVAGTNKREVTATVVEKPLGQVGTIISGDGLRLSSDKKSVYATKENVKTVVRLEDNTIIEYTVTVDENGHYVLNENILPATNTTTITAADLGLTGNITATGLDANIATKLEFGNTITLSGKAEGKTSLVVTDENNKTVIANVAVDTAGVITVSPVVQTEASTTPQLIHAEDASIVRIEGTKLFAIGTGTAEVLVGNSIQQVTVTKINGEYSITVPTEISTAVYTSENLGFATDTDLTIETGYDKEKFYVDNIDGKIIAYSKLTGTTIGATEVKITATGTTLSTLIRLNDKGATFAHKIAKTAHAFTGITNVQDATIARYNNGDIYLFKTGHTYVTVDGRMQALDVTRDPEGDLTAIVRPLEVKDGTNFTKVASTDSNIIEISADKTKLYAKGFGTTQVQDGDKVLTVQVVKDENNKVTMSATEVSSKFVTVGDAGLDKFTDVTLLHGTPNALSFNRDENNGVTIYSNGSVKSETFAVKVTDGTHHAVINVTVNDAGVISDATVSKTTIKNVGITANETIQTTNARAVWNNNEITIYALEQGNAAFKFTNGLVNAQVAKSGNILSPLSQLLQHTFDSELNTVSNGTIVKLFNDSKSIYPIGEGTALARTNDKLYTINVAKANEQYALTVSDGVPMTLLDLTTASGTYSVDESELVGAKAVEDKDDNTLVIYKDGTGVSDIAITTADGKAIYHVTATNSEMNAPVLAKKTLTSDMTGAALLEGSAVRQKNNDLYYLATGNAIFKASDNRLLNVIVKRDSNTKYFTSTETFASAELKEIPTDALTHYKLIDQTAYALNGIAEETFLTANYRTTLTTTKNGAAYEVKADERLAKQFDFVPFGLSSTIDSFTPQNVAAVEERNGKLVIYAGTEDGTTTIDVTDNNGKTVKFNVSRANNGTVFTVTPLVAVESVKFADIGLDGTTPIKPTVYDNSIATVLATETGLNISAMNPGSTSITLEQNNVIVGLINVVVDANKNVTSTPVQMTANGTLLHSTMLTAPRTTADKGTFITSVGTSLFETAAGRATLMRVSQNITTGFYTVETSEHGLSKLNLTDLGLNSISSVALTGSSVGTFTKPDGTELYVYGTNNGVTDIVVTEKVSETESKQTLIVANNASGLTTTVAKQPLADKDKLSPIWSTNLVEIRDHVIYATQSGKAVAEATVSGHKVLMNITVTRNTNQTFAITHNVVAHDLAATGTVIDGDSVVVSGNRIFAQKIGTSTVQVGTEIYQATVKQTAEGLFEMEVSEAVVQKTLTAAQLGMTEISSYNIKALTGAGVVSAKIVGANKDQLIIFAKNAGQAEITVTGNQGNTIVHTGVTDTVNGLTLATHIAETELIGASSINDTSGTFRGYADKLYALKPGHVVTHVNDQLHNLKATLNNNVLEVTANRIEKDMEAAVTVNAGDTVVTTEGTKLVAIGFGETFVTVGSKTYRVKVNNDGTMQTELLVADTIDVGEALSSITNHASLNPAKVTIKGVTGTQITFEPKEVGIEIIELSDGTGTIQVEVTVTADAEGKNTVTSKLISNSYDAGVIGFYPTGIEGATKYNSEQGVLNIGTDGVITFYPGKAGSSHVLIKGMNKQAIYDLTVATDHTFTFKPLTLTVAYNQFLAYPTVIDKSGNATAKQGMGGVEVTFVDTEETVFVLQGESGYKTLLVQVEKLGNKYEVAKSVVGIPLVESGSVTNINGNLRIIEKNDETVIYADKNTAQTATYTANNQLHKVTVGTDYALTQETITLATTLTSASHIQGENVATIVNGKWQAIKEGTGIYRTNEGYVKVDVTLAATNPITITPLSSLDASTLGTSVTLMDEYEELYVDGSTIYGSFANEFVTKVDGKLYKGSLAANQLNAVKVNLLEKLGWTSYASTNFDNANIVKIEDNMLYATGKGTQNITFTSPTGLSRTLVVTVDDQYNLTVTAEANIITYTSRTISTNDGEYDFTFSLNLDNTNLDLAKVKGGSTSIGTNKTIIMTKTPGSTMESEFKIVLPELGTNSTQNFIISLTSDDKFTITPITTESALQFNKVESATN